MKTLKRLNHKKQTEEIKLFANSNDFRLYFFEKFILVVHNHFGSFRVKSLKEFYKKAITYYVNI